MPQTAEYRTWLGNHFKVCQYETGSADDLLERAAAACKLVHDSKQVTNLVESLNALAPSTESGQLKVELEKITKAYYPFNNIQTKYQKPEEYNQAKGTIERIYQTASKLGGLEKKYSEESAKAKEAHIFAKHIVAAHSDVEDPNSVLLQSGQAILAHINTATEKRSQANYEAAIKSLKDAVTEFKNNQQKIQDAQKNGAQETEEAKQREQAAFKLYSGDSKKMRDMVGNKELMSLMTGVKFDADIGYVKSESLKEMEKAFDAALSRYDKLKKSGLDPIAAAGIALANIPRVFWPDRAIREIAMFERVEEAIRLEEAEREALSLEEVIERGEGFQDPAALGVNTTTDTMESVLKIQLGISLKDSLPKVGATKDSNGNPLSEQTKSLIKLQSDFANAGKGVQAFGVFLKAVTAISKTKDLASTEFEGPVQKKIAEFEAQVAWFDVARSAKDMGADLLKEVCPALGVVTSAIDMVESMYLAAKYFKKLHDIQVLGEKAKRDPDSVMYLPLIRMDKNERLKAAEQVVSFVEKALATSGKAVQLTGLAAGVGLGIDAAGKIVAQGSKVVFKGIRWSDAQKAKTSLLKAKGPPVDREAVEKVFKYSNLYATYCIAISAVEDNDTWAIRYCLKSGLEENEISDIGTSIEVLRKYIVLEAKIDDKQQTFSEELADSTLIKPFVFIANKIKGSKPKDTYEPSDILDEETNVRIPNPNYKPLATDIALTRDAWQKAKAEAKGIGWYDDKSGLGDVLTEYQQAKTGWETAVKNKKDYLTSPNAVVVAASDSYYKAMRRLDSFLSTLRPLASDRVTTFEPMQSFQNGMLSLVRQEQLDASTERSVFLQTFFETSGNDGGKDKLVEEQKTQAAIAEKRVKEVDGLIAKLIKETQWDSPLGSTTLAKFSGLVCEKLGIAASVVGTRIQDAIAELERDLVASAKDELGGSLPDALPKDFQVLRKNELNDTAYETFELFASQARAIRDEALGVVPTLVELTTPVTLESKNWLAAIQESMDKGQKNWKGVDSSLVTMALTTYEEEKLRFEKSGIVHYAGNAQDGLAQVAEFLEKLSPLDADGLLFKPMETYIDSLVKLIQPEKARLADQVKKAFAYTLPTTFNLTTTEWEKVKKVLIEKLMKDSSTGIGKALKVVELKKDIFDQKKDTNNAKAYVKSLDSLGEVLLKFNPMTPSKKSHPPGLEVKKRMIVLMNEAYAEAEEIYHAGIKTRPPVSLVDVTQKKWETAKKEFVDYGMVNKKTGVGKAINAFVTAKGKSDKDKNNQELLGVLNEARTQLISIVDSAKPLDSLGRVFAPGVKYLLKIVELVSA